MPTQTQPPAVDPMALLQMIFNPQAYLQAAQDQANQSPFLRAAQPAGAASPLAGVPAGGLPGGVGFVGAVANQAMGAAPARVNLADHVPSAPQGGGQMVRMAGPGGGMAQVGVYDPT